MLRTMRVITYRGNRKGCRAAAALCRCLRRLRRDGALNTTRICAKSWRNLSPHGDGQREWCPQSRLRPRRVLGAILNHYRQRSRMCHCRMRRKPTSRRARETCGGSRSALLATSTRRKPPCRYWTSPSAPRACAASQVPAAESAGDVHQNEVTANEDSAVYCASPSAPRICDESQLPERQDTAIRMGVVDLG